MRKAYEALDEFRHHLQVCVHVDKFKRWFTRGQAADTREQPRSVVAVLSAERE